MLLQPRTPSVFSHLFSRKPAPLAKAAVLPPKLPAKVSPKVKLPSKVAAEPRRAAPPPVPSFVHLVTAARAREVMDQEVEANSRGNDFAARVLGAGARAEGKSFDPATMIAGPSQRRVRVSGSDILEAVRRGKPSLLNQDGRR